jgi:hypothetical protein
MGVIGTETHRQSSAELRRLHEAHDWQYRMAGDRLRRIERLEAQRDELLEALRKIAAIEDSQDGGDWEEIEQARSMQNAAIKAAEGEKWLDLRAAAQQALEALDLFCILRCVCPAAEKAGNG